MTAPQTGDTLELTDILRLLPHRYPFLLIDRIIRIRGDDFCVGIKNVTFNEPFFQGHFPSRPVMPGVLLLEGMAQSAGAVCARFVGTDNTATTYFLTIDKAKFRRPVVPGDIVEYHLTKKARRKNMWWYRGEAMVGGQLACEAEVGAMVESSAL
jgi:3-hydroxyacyl-[acyl-carrier-protein] dehydratase